MINDHSQITLDDLLADDFHLVTYTPRYGDGPGAEVGVFIGGNIEELAMIADAMTDSGDYCQHIEHMLYRTPYFPWGVGSTFQQAVDKALERVNTVKRHVWFNAMRNVVCRAISDYPAIREAYTDWPALPSVEESMVDWEVGEEPDPPESFMQDARSPPSFAWTEESIEPMVTDMFKQWQRLLSDQPHFMHTEIVTTADDYAWLNPVQQSYTVSW